MHLPTVRRGKGIERWTKPHGKTMVMVTYGTNMGEKKTMEKPYGKIFLQISNSHDCNLSHSGHPFFDRNSDAIRINLLGDRARGL
jgi:hypothetical protein